jgi:5-methylcytosine-specific restriction enzyme subunit McrC
MMHKNSPIRLSSVVRRPSSVLTLREFETRQVALTPGAYQALRVGHAGEVDVGPTDEPGVYRITARDYVGRIGLPGGWTLVVQPKVEVSCLFYMLCADPALARFHGTPVGLARSAGIHTIVLAALLRELESLLGGGLNIGYVLREKDLALVHGRILLGQQLGRYGDLKHRHVCAYADLTADTDENRIVLATMRLLPALLASPDESGFARRARALIPRFEGVTAVSRKSALALLDRMEAHRFNARYAQLLGLCRLVLAHTTLDERGGPHPFASFLVNMPRLFESFVTARLRALLPAYGLRVVAQRHDYLDEERRVGIRPDILVYPRSGTRPVLVLDAKYRRVDDPASDINRDLYQISAYLDRYTLRHGLLVYPQFEGAANRELRVKGAPKHLHLTTLNLAAPTPADIEQNARSLAEEVARLARTQQV